MKIRDILNEISNAERARRARLSAQSKRATTTNTVTPAPPRQKGVPANVPPQSFYKKDPKAALDDGPFGSPEFDQYKIDPNDNPEAGIVLQFEVVTNPRTKQKQLYTYWSKDWGTSFDGIRQFSDRIYPIITPYGEDFIDYLKSLIEKHKAVHVAVGKEAAALMPRDFKNFAKWVEKYQAKDPIGNLNFEFLDNKTDTVPSTGVIAKVPTAAKTIPNARNLEQKVIQQIRGNANLYATYAAVTSDARKSALAAGVEELHDTDDLDAALDAVAVSLDNAR